MDKTKISQTPTDNKNNPLKRDEVVLTKIKE